VHQFTLRHILEYGDLKIHRPDIIIFTITTRSKRYSPLLALQRPENFLSRAKMVTTNKEMEE
jgi:hypothetical protein